MPENEKERKPFLTELDKHAIWEAARWAADEGAGDLLTVVNDIIARHVGYALFRRGEADFWETPGEFVDVLMDFLSTQGMYAISANYDDRTGHIDLSGVVRFPPGSEGRS